MSEQTETPIEAPAGGAVSFSDLEAIVAAKKEESQHDEGVHEAEDENAEDIEEGVKAEEEQGEEGEDSSSKDSEQSPKEIVKSLSFKVPGEKGAVDIPSNAVISLKVNGEDMEVPLADLRDNYAGKVPWVKKFQELDKERKEFEADRKVVDESLQRFYDLCKADKWEDALDFFVESSGGDPFQFKQELQKALIPRVEEFAKLSPEERRARDIAAENEMLKRRDQVRQERQAEQKHLKEIGNHVQALMKEKNIPEEVFVERYQELKNSGQVEQADLTPELVVEYHEHVTRQSAVKDLLESVDIDQKIKDGAVKQMIEVYDQNPDLTISQLKEIVMEVYGSSKAQNLSRKVRRSKPQAVRSAPGPKNVSSDPVNFDDL